MPPRASRPATWPGSSRHRARRTAARAGRGAAATVPGLVEPLTGRELEVLRLLTAGRPNQGIADELVITLDTALRSVQGW